MKYWFAIVCVVCAASLIANGNIEGWGWLLFFAILAALS